MSLGSPYYWTVVAGLAALIAASTIVVRRDRVDLPGFHVAWVIYVTGWIALGAVTASPLFFGSLNVMPNAWPPVWAGVPLALTVGILAALVGGHLIAWLVGMRGFLLHPRRIAAAWRRDSHSPRARLTDAELRQAEAYDDQWQIEDRKRNKRLGTGPRL